MSARSDYFSLGELEKLDGVICVRCWDCARHRFLLPSQLMRDHGCRPGKVIKSLVFRCPDCKQQSHQVCYYTPYNPR